MADFVNARILIEPHVARAMEERHGTPRRGNTPHGGVNRTQVVNRDLGRYYDLITEARRRIRDRFPAEEQLLIVQALQSTYTATWALGMLAVEVQEYIEDASDGADDASAHPLVVKLRALSPTEELAIIDAVERWRQHGRGRGEPMTVPVL